MEIAIADQDQIISQAIEKEGLRLRNYIRKHVADRGAAEDILQEVFFELIEAYRLMKPIEQVSGWLFRVAKNRIVDLFRTRKLDSLSEPAFADEEDGASLEDLLPSPDAGPEAEYVRGVLVEELADALAELPEGQRWVFVEHEIEGRSFRELAEETGVGINTLLSRKRYAVLALRKRLEAIYDNLQKKK